MDRMRKNVLLLSISQALLMTSNSLLIATSALVGRQLAPYEELATLPIAVQFGLTMLFSFPASLFMKRYGRRRGFLTGAAAGLLGAATCTYGVLFGNFVFFVLGAALIGAANGFAIFYRFAALDTATASYQSRAIAYVLAGGVVAAFAGPNLARFTQLAIESTPFAASYLALTGVFALSILFLAFLDIPPVHERMYSQPVRPLTGILRQPLFLIALLCGMLGYGIMSLIMNATPLAMKASSFSFADTTWVIQWHVVGMFAPSFFTGSLIDRYGVRNVLLAGALLNALCIGINLSGQEHSHYWLALMSLGIGWNFLFIGATRLLAETYNDAEKARAQGLNDFFVFSAVSLTALGAAPIHAHWGWQAINQMATIPLVIVFAAIAALYVWSFKPIATPATENELP